jgi:hypothetical protein
MIKISILCFIIFIFHFGSAQSTLLSTDFQSGIPLSFSILDQDANSEDPSMTEFLNQSAWIGFSDPDSATNFVAAATSYFSPIDTANRWLITPSMTLGSFGNRITWKAKSHDPSYPDDYLVLISHTDASITSFTDTIGSIEEENFEWTTRTVDLSQKGYDDSTVYVAFVLRTFDGFKLYIDDILVEKDIDANAVETPSELEISVYPNPCKSLLNIQGINGPFTGEIRSIQQQLLQIIDSTEVNVENLPSGVFILNLKTENQLITKRFIKN